MKKTAYLIFVFAAAVASTVYAQPAPLEIADNGNDMERVWHLGRVTGDLERIIHFYHDLLGLGFRGDRNAPIPFYSVDSINEFVNAPANAEFRAAFMPIPGTSAAVDPGEQIYLEAFEYRNITRRQEIPALTDTGVSNLRFYVRGLDGVVGKLKDEAAAFITPDGEPVPVRPPDGFSGTARAVMVRDPDGYPVELVEISPLPVKDGGASPVIGAAMSLVVEDLDDSLDFYRRFIGADLRAWKNGGWRQDTGFSRLRNLPGVEFRSAGMLLPGSSVVLELIEFRNAGQGAYRPVFQDIGFGHVAFMTRDIEVITGRMQDLGIRPLSQSGTWTRINPNLRAVYTRDRDGFFLEIIE